MHKGFHSAAEEVAKFKEAVVGVGEALMIFEGAKMIKEYITSTIEAIGQSNILAERVGFSAEAFQKLSYAASFAHLGQDELAVSLGQLSKRLGEVAMTGEGKAADALKRFGLSASELAKQGPEKAFYTILDVMRKIENPAERSAIAVELFGKAGQGMINLVARGAPELKQMTEEASRMGVAMDGIQNAKAMEAEEAMIKLSAAASGFANLLIVEIAPYLTLVIDKYMEWAYSGTKSANFVSSAMEVVAGVIGTIVDTFNILKAAFYSFAVVGGTVIKALLLPLHGLDEAIRSINDSLTGKTHYSNFQLFYEELNKAIEDSANKLAETAGKVGQGVKTVKDVMAAFRASSDARAKVKAGEAAKFIDPGDITKDATKGKKGDKEYFAALDYGTKEAYSAILAAKNLRDNPQQDALVKNTQVSAETGQQSLMVLKSINDALLRGAGGAMVAGLNKA